MLLPLCLKSFPNFSFPSVGWMGFVSCPAELLRGRTGQAGVRSHAPSKDLQSGSGCRPRSHRRSPTLSQLAHARRTVKNSACQRLASTARILSTERTTYWSLQETDGMAMSIVKHLICPPRAAQIRYSVFLKRIRFVYFGPVSRLLRAVVDALALLNS